MAKDATAIGIIAAGTAINALTVMQKGKPVTSTLFGGGAFALACVAINAATPQNLGTAMALVFLLSSFLTNGVRLIDSIITAISALEERK